MADPEKGLHLDAAIREDALRRLRSLTGHVAGIRRMLENDDVYCVDALKQIKAVIGALERVSGLILRSHLRHHVTTAHERGDEDELVEELMEILKYR